MRRKFDVDHLEVYFDSPHDLYSYDTATNQISSTSRSLYLEINHNLRVHLQSTMDKLWCILQKIKVQRFLILKDIFLQKLATLGSMESWPLSPRALLRLVESKSCNTWPVSLVILLKRSLSLFLITSDNQNDRLVKKSVNQM